MPYGYSYDNGDHDDGDDSGDIALSLPRSRSDHAFLSRQAGGGMGSGMGMSIGAMGVGTGLASIPGQQPGVSTSFITTGLNSAGFASSSSSSSTPRPTVPLPQRVLNKDLPASPHTPPHASTSSYSSTNPTLGSSSPSTSGPTQRPRDVSAPLPHRLLARHGPFLSPSGRTVSLGTQSQTHLVPSSADVYDASSSEAGGGSGAGSMPVPIRPSTSNGTRQESDPTPSPDSRRNLVDHPRSIPSAFTSEPLPNPATTTPNRPSELSLGGSSRTSSLGRSRSLNVRIPGSSSTYSTPPSSHPSHTQTPPSSRLSHGPSTGTGTGTSGPSTGSGSGPGTGADSTSPSTPSTGLRQQPASATTPFGPSPSMRLGFLRRPGEPRPPPLVGTEVARAMARWVKEIAVCNFDLERGPVVERRAMGRRWGPGEKENVAFSSFPDTSLFSEGSITFSFKIRHMPPDPSSLSLPEPPSPLPDSAPSVESALLDSSVPPFFPSSSAPSGGVEESLGPSASAGAGAPVRTPESPASPRKDGPVLAAAKAKAESEDKADEYRKWDERGREWLFGFVWFEQRRDRGIARGYMQKSVVILTHLPFPALFFAVLDRIAPSFFEYGYSALEVACHSIASWPDPAGELVLELPVLSDLLTVRLPDSTESPQIGQAFGQSNPERPIPLLASLPRSTPLRAFASFLPSLWSIWECLVLAEPVLVIAPDPQTCSEIVWWLRDLMRPIPPAGDFRPYLHIHDHDFSLLINSNKPQAGAVVGVTNPFFRNAASHWPNVISIPPDRPRRSAGTGPGSGPAGNHVSPMPSPRPGAGAEQPEGFITKRQRNVQKDRALLKRLEALVAEGKLDDPGGNEALRIHFQQLTEKFLVPLNRYFQTLVPNRSPNPSPIPWSASPHVDPSTSSSASATGLTSTLSTIRPFSLPAFLAHLRATGPNPLLFRTKGLSTKSRVENDFYAAFSMGGSFAGWLAGRVESVGVAVAEESERIAAASGQGSRVSSLTVPSRNGGRSPGYGSSGSGHSAPLSASGSRAQRTPPVGLGITSPTLGDPVIDLNDDTETSSVGQETTTSHPRTSMTGSSDDDPSTTSGTVRDSEESGTMPATSGVGAGGAGAVATGGGGYDLYARRASEGVLGGGFSGLSLGK